MAKNRGKENGETGPLPVRRIFNPERRGRKPKESRQSHRLAKIAPVKDVQKAEYLLRELLLESDE